MTCCCGAKSWRILGSVNRHCASSESPWVSFLLMDFTIRGIDNTLARVWSSISFPRKSTDSHTGPNTLKVEISVSRWIRIYRLDLSGACRVACALGWNSIVKSLDMTCVRLKSWWAREFWRVLEQNKSLKEVNLSKTWLQDKRESYMLQLDSSRTKVCQAYILTEIGSTALVWNTSSALWVGFLPYNAKPTLLWSL